MIVSSKIKLSTLLHELSNMLENSNISGMAPVFVTPAKTKHHYLMSLTNYPIVLYTKKGSLHTNSFIEDIKPFLRLVHHSPLLMLLLYIRNNFSHVVLENIEVECILVETSPDIYKVDSLINLIFLDFFLKRNISGKAALKSGKLDFEKLEKLFFLQHTKKEYKSLLKKPGKYFYQSLLGLNIMSRKRDK